MRMHAAVAAFSHSKSAAGTGLLVLLLACTVLQRFGLSLGPIAVSLAFAVMYAVVIGALLARRLEVAPERFIVYSICVLVAAAALAVNRNFAPGGDASSLTSFLLLLALHLPLVFRITTTTPATEQPALKYLADIAFFCAVCGIVQFYAQFFIRAPWLFDFSMFVPDMLRAPGEFNTAIGMDGRYKSNGFFFREPSGFSYTVALGLIIEWLRYKRPLRLAMLGLALLLSYSGTGLLTLAIALLFPLGAKSVVRVATVGVVAALVYWLLGDALNLSFTLERVHEFESERSSGYIRYVAPLRFVLDHLGDTPWSAWLGHGPGTISRASRLAYEFHDPTWAKLLYEYGMLGFTAFVALMLIMMRASGMEVQIRAVILLHWLVMGGLLLKAECVATTFALFALYTTPQTAKRSQPVSSSLLQRPVTP